MRRFERLGPIAGNSMPSMPLFPARWDTGREHLPSDDEANRLPDRRSREPWQIV